MISRFACTIFEEATRNAEYGLCSVAAPFLCPCPALLSDTLMWKVYKKIFTVTAAGIYGYAGSGRGAAASLSQHAAHLS